MCLKPLGCPVDCLIQPSACDALLLPPACSCTSRPAGNLNLGIRAKSQNGNITMMWQAWGILKCIRIKPDQQRCFLRYIAARFDSKIKGNINSPHCIFIFIFRTAHSVYITNKHLRFNFQKYKKAPADSGNGRIHFEMSVLKNKMQKQKTFYMYMSAKLDLKKWKTN